MRELYKKIPQVSKLLDDKQVSEYQSRFYQAEIKETIESVLSEVRNKIKEKQISEVNYDNIVNQIVEQLNKKQDYSLRRVINGTGTVVHTNLGRSILPPNAIRNIINVSSSYNNLEYDIENGTRGSRYAHLEDTVAKILGAESAVVVNNNAAAVMLAVGAFSKNKEVIVSRGELVEIGGSFRIPDIIEASGAKLKEVGTTNRTHKRDYENAINEDTAMILKVHPSNYALLGFTKEVNESEIAEIAEKHNQTADNKVITAIDLGSGALVDFLKYGVQKETTVQESLASGVDLVTFSGDKLFGGPQAGIIVGKKELIDKIKKHPLTRAFRVCKLTIAGLEGTLKYYLDEKEAIKHIPTLNMIFKSKEVLKQVADDLSANLNKIDNCNSDVTELNSTIGGGSMPLSKLSSYGVIIKIAGLSTNDIEQKLRDNKVPIVGRVFNDMYCIDVRTLLENDVEIIVKAIKSIT